MSGQRSELNSSDGIDTILRIWQETDKLRKPHITMFLDLAGLPDDEQDQLTDLLAPLCDVRPPSLTVLINDPDIFPSSFASTRRLLAALSSLSHPSRNVQWLIYSPLTTLPHLAGLQGAFCTGSRRLVEKVQFLAGGVMYTAMMPPVTAALAEESVRRLLG